MKGIPALRLLCVAFVTGTCAANDESSIETRVLNDTLSPNKRMAIVEEKAPNGNLDFFFVDRSNGTKLGFVLPAELRHEISNVAFVTSWNRSSTKVALVMSYGTKLSALSVFARNTAGKFEKIQFQCPDPEGLYRRAIGRTISHPGDGHSENVVGPWLDDDNVRLLAGDATQTIPEPDADGEVSLDKYNHLFVSFRVCIRDSHATTSHVKLIGPLSNAEADKFKKRWGKREP